MIFFVCKKWPFGPLSWLERKDSPTLRMDMKLKIKLISHDISLLVSTLFCWWMILVTSLVTHSECPPLPPSIPVVHHWMEDVHSLPNNGTTVFLYATIYYQRISSALPSKSPHMMMHAFTSPLLRWPRDMTSMAKRLLVPLLFHLLIWKHLWK